MVQLHCGDCLEILPKLESGSVHMVLADPPYGTTACKWDSVIPLAPMWTELKRIIRPRGAIVLTASQPFTTALISSNMEVFKYCWVWDKKNPTGFLDAKLRPLRRTEDVCLFCEGQPTYNPVMRTGVLRWKGGFSGDAAPVYNEHQSRPSFGSEYYPTNLLEISNANRSEKEHPTQKPVALMEYLIRTYTNPGETVLDFCMGSGTTGVACALTGRSFIGIESDPNYFAIAKRRIEETSALPPLFAAAENASLFAEPPC